MRKNKVFPIRWLVFAVLVTAMVTSVTFSRYISTISGVGTAQIARFHVSVSAPQRDDMSFDGSSFGPDAAQTLSYDISVTSDSDVDVECTFTVSFGTALPEGVSVTLEGAQATSTDKGVYTFSGLTIPASNKEANIYTLAITVNYLTDGVEGAVNPFDPATYTVNISVRADQAI